MAGANWRPDLFYGLAMNADPNDPLAYPVWADWTTGLLRVEGYERGRTFELDQGESSAPTVTTRDVNEYLNPDNLTGPYVGLVEPYRPVMLAAQWPRQADITGGSVNLFNVNAWRGNKESALDPTLESFAVGSRPTWAGAVGGTAPSITNIAPFQGAQALKWDTVAGATVQGGSWPVPCIPGQQYTSSVYVTQNAASTQQVGVVDQVIGYEAFNVAAASSWGTATQGGAWTLQGGSAANFNKGVTTLSGDRVGTALCAAINVRRMQTLATTFTDGLVWTEFSFDAAPPTTNHQAGVVARFVDASNFYQAQAHFAADGSVSVSIQKIVAGAVTSIVGPTAVPGLVWAVGERYRVALTLAGTALAAYVWRPAVSPALPATANVSGTDSAFTTGKTGLNAMNTDAAITPTFSFFGHGVLGVVAGTSTASTAGYVRLSVTWTATAPVHLIRVATVGTALLGSVNVDALQHERGAAASTFIATGPNIFPVVRANLEQYQRSYESQGFEGIVTSPCVDAMAALQALDLEAEYVEAVMATAPDFYWRLNDGLDTAAFVDSSGNGRPPLLAAAGKYGGGLGFEAGTAIPLPGDPGAVGVTFNSNLAGTPPGNTILGTGPSAGLLGSSTLPVSVPPVAIAGTPWAVSGAAWVKLTPVAVTMTPLTFQSSFGANLNYRPFQLRIGPADVSLMLITGVTSTQAVSGAIDLRDDQLHHVAGSVSQDPTNTTLTLYIDGAVAGTTTVSTATAGALTLSANSVYVGGTFLVGDAVGVLNGTETHVSAWNRVITAAEVTSMYQAGKLGFAGENTGTRNARHIALGGYRGPTRITTTGVMTTMQPPSWSGKKDGLTDVLETTTAEQGTFWAAPDGYVVMESRQDRWLRLTPALTIGEDVAGGEIPYLMDSLRFNLDPLYVFANVTVGRNNGATAVGGRLFDIARAARRYFPRAASGGYDFADDTQPQDMANWIFYSHRAPMIRAVTIEIDPVGYPALWPTMLGLEIGRRVRVIRRAKAANSGAGLTITHDFFVEKIGISEIDMKACTWKYKIQLSPINAGSSAQGAPTMQPWILEDTTYGVLDSTTVLGW